MARWNVASTCCGNCLVEFGCSCIYGTEIIYVEILQGGLYFTGEGCPVSFFVVKEGVLGFLLNRVTYLDSEQDRQMVGGELCGGFPFGV